MCPPEGPCDLASPLHGAPGFPIRQREPWARVGGEEVAARAPSPVVGLTEVSAEG